MDQPTLTERVARVEKVLGSFLRSNGMDEPMQDEGDLATGDYDIGLNLGLGKVRFDMFVSTEEAQKFRNFRQSQRIHDERAGQPASSALDEVMQRISEASTRVRVITKRLEEIGDRIYGAEEEGTDERATVEAMPDGTLNRTIIILNGLDYSLARLEETAQRLVRI